MVHVDFEKIKNWNGIVYERVVRGEDSYRQTEELFATELTRLLSMYSTFEDLQRRRLVRDLIDFCLRRVHGYCIRERIVAHAHYHQDELGMKSVFEHLIPTSILRDLLLGGVMPIRYAFHAPIVMLSEVAPLDETAG